MNLGVVPIAVREQLRARCTFGNIDDAWDLWSLEAEAGLFRAELLGQRAPSLLSGPQEFVDRGS